MEGLVRDAQLRCVFLPRHSTIDCKVNWVGETDESVEDDNDLLNCVVVNKMIRNAKPSMILLSFDKVSL